MNIKLLTKRNFFIIVLISTIYLFYASIFLKPWLFRNFSLVDDGQVLVQSSSYLDDCVLRFRCSKFLDQTFEFGTSRFRPSYWLVNNLVYEVFRNNAELHHAFRIYVVGYLMILLLSLILLDLGVGWLFLITGVFIFVSNYSFSENIIRLGTNEPYQVIFLAIFSLLYLRSKEKRGSGILSPLSPILIILLTWTIFIKENNIAVLPAILLTEYVFVKKRVLKKVLVFIGLPFLLLVLGTVISRIMPSSISGDIPVYTSNYVTNLVIILDNSIANLRLLVNSLSPFLKLSILLFPLLYVNKRIREKLRNKKFYYWMFFTIFFTLILFPWRYVLDRYQLVSIFGISIVTTLLFDHGLRFIRNSILPKSFTLGIYGVLFDIASFVIAMNLFFRGFPLNLAKTVNYREWFSAFTQFESDQVRAIALYNDQKVYINGKNNINNWEFLYEIPIHIRFLYELKQNVYMLETLENQEGYIFSRSSFDSAINTDNLEKAGYRIVDSKSYYIDQIDPIRFRQGFVNQPLRTILNPPLSESGFDYYWEVRKEK